VFAPAYITGSGLVTALGRSVASTFDAISGGGVMLNHAPIQRAETRAFGVPQTRLAGISKVASLGFEAAGQAIDQSGWTAGQLADPETALIVCTSKGPVREWLAADAARVSRPRLEPSGTGGTPVLRESFGLASLTTELATNLTGITTGPRLLVSAACASGLHGIARAVMLLRSRTVRRALVVAAEASVHPLFIGSFNRLGVLCPAGEPCRPFDVRRRGFHIADAAAAVCLELQPRLDHPAGGTIFIDCIAIAGDASHLTGSNTDGRVLRHVLKSVVAGNRVDFVHAHGTGTIINDQIELAAIDSVIDRTVPVFSHKAAIGHTLGASSLVSVVLTAETHRRSMTLPNVASDHPAESRFASIESSSRSLTIRRSLVTAAGFGGAIAAATLSTSN
jgi:3-oxoacyl-[acyl-carrier-protein] synthase II